MMLTILVCLDYLRAQGGYLGWVWPREAGGIGRWFYYDFSGYDGLRVLGFTWGPDGA